MIKRNYSRMLLNLVIRLFLFFGLSLLISFGPLPFTFLVSFPNFQIKSDLWEIMGFKEVFPGSKKQIGLFVPCVKVALRT